jgi:glucan phosphoethanolaminetransferase (alkaline phosphatase superfamily)
MITCVAPLWERARSASRRALSLLGVFVAAKGALVALRLVDGGDALFATPLVALVLLYQDASIVLAWAFLDVTVLCIFAGHERAVNRVGWIVYALATLYVAVNVPIARVFSTPLTYSMLGATGGALLDSIRAYVSVANCLATAAVVVVGALAPRAVAGGISKRRMAASAVALLVAALGGALLAPRIETLGLHRNALLTVAFTTSARLGAASRPPAPTENPSLPSEGRGLDLSHLKGAARGRNVMWIILESTGASYLGSYGAQPDPTPKLSALAEHAIIFDHAYCAYPESIKGLFSMLCASHPVPYLHVSEYVAGKRACSSVADVLRQAGYRTGFFHSGRFRYLGMQGILDQRGFSELHDAESIGGAYASSFGTDDASTAERVLEFVDSVPEGQPFFAVYSPIAGHHPYRTPGPRQEPFAGATEFDHYRNDLFTGDLALGRILDGMRKRGLFERTLFMIVGDHGEAFAQHPGNFAHTLYLYEENVRVPFIVAAPGLLVRRVHAPQLVSLVDLAPTTLSLLGLSVPTGYQGRSALDPGAGMAIFFTDHDLLKAGLRHGRFKFIHEQEHARQRLYDLAADPGEHRNLAAADPARVELYRGFLLRWLRDNR